MWITFLQKKGGGLGLGYMKKYLLMVLAISFLTSSFVFAQGPFLLWWLRSKSNNQKNAPGLDVGEKVSRKELQGGNWF